MSSLPYFFAPDIDTSSAQLILPEETSKHCIQVLRMQNGDACMLADGKGNICRVTITNADRKHCAVRIEESSYVEKPLKQISVAVSLVKNTSRFEWFLEKAVEIGVWEVVPLICKRTERDFFRADRMQQIMVSAMLQSQQSWLPALSEPVQFDKLVTTSSYTTKLIAHCIDETSKQNITSLSRTNDVQLLIGPEGDFDTTEIELALQHNYIPVSLGETRLRTETAAIVGVTLLQNT